MKKLSTTLFLMAVALPAAGQNIVGDDLYVDTVCVGFDCIVNGESFGFDSIRLKENNLRIHFDDTSNSASFPLRDWRIAINDTANGGAEYFAIDDATAGSTPFKIEGAAPNSALYVDDAGNVGLGTSMPAVELHSIDGDTPTLRLEQDISAGFTAQTWDVAGNETNFFVRDVTNASQIPFKIRPGAPSDALVIGPTGNVGVGATNNPSAPLNVRRTDTAQVLVENTSGTPAPRDLFVLRNAGNTKFQIEETASATSWAFTNSGTDFRVSLQGSGVVEFAVNNAGDGTIANDFEVGNDLNVMGTIFGTVAAPSDVNIKQDFIFINPTEVLAKVVALPISQWSYKTAPGVQHIGPMAQDFHQAFGLGNDDKSITMVDANGVAFAAIQALNAENESLKQRISELEAQQQRIDTLEKMVSSLAEELDQRPLHVSYEP